VGFIITNLIPFSEIKIIRFPPKIYNLRVKVFLDEFFSDYGIFLNKLGINHEFELEFSENEDNGRCTWKYGNIFLTGKIDVNQDSILNHFQLVLQGFPFLIACEPTLQFATTLVLRIMLQRSYPALVNLTKVSFDTIPFHPNVNPITGKFGNRTFGGEIDSVIWDLIQLMLFENERVLPTDKIDEAVDFALNKDAMNWYKGIKKDFFYQENLNRFKKELERFITKVTFYH
jgi:hypothetical protein